MHLLSMQSKPIQLLIISTCSLLAYVKAAHAQSEYANRYNAISELSRSSESLGAQAGTFAVRINEPPTASNEGEARSPFGWRGRVYFPTRPNRLFSAPARGSEIQAIGAGRVAYAGWFGGYGRAVIINYNSGLQTIYPHLSEFFVHTGETVDPIQKIGLLGSSGFGLCSFDSSLVSRARKPKPRFDMMVHPGIPFEKLILKGSPDHGQLGGI